MADPAKAAEASVTGHRERQSFKSAVQRRLQSYFTCSDGRPSTISNLDTPVLGAIGLQEAPRTLHWTVATGTSFSTAADRDDTTGGLNPAQRAPGAIDTAQFLTGGGAISGTGTAAALQFGGSVQWDVASAASLSAVSSVTVGEGGSGAVLVNGSASINGLISPGHGGARGGFLLKSGYAAVSRRVAPPAKRHRP